MQSRCLDAAIALVGPLLPMPTCVFMVCLILTVIVGHRNDLGSSLRSQFDPLVGRPTTHLNSSVPVDNSPVAPPPIRVLMLIAHPDDEVIFGARDLLQSNCSVICFTNAKNPIRSREFQACLRTAGAVGWQLDFHDSMTDDWPSWTDEQLVDHVVSVVGHAAVSSFTAVVSHDADAEYGHIQHKRLHGVARLLALRVGCPFWGFRSRWLTSITNSTERERLLDVYESQRSVVQFFKQFYETNP